MFLQKTYGALFLAIGDIYQCQFLETDNMTMALTSLRWLGTYIRRR